MPRTVAQRFAEPHSAAGVERIHGLVGGWPTDAIGCQGKIERIDVRHGEEAVRQALDR